MESIISHSYERRVLLCLVFSLDSSFWQSFWQMPYCMRVFSHYWWNCSWYRSETDRLVMHMIHLTTEMCNSILISFAQLNIMQEFTAVDGPTIFCYSISFFSSARVYLDPQDLVAKFCARTLPTNNSLRLYLLLLHEFGGIFTCLASSAGVWSKVPFQS